MKEFCIIIKAQITLGKQLISLNTMQKQCLIEQNTKQSTAVTLQTEQIMHQIVALESKKQQFLQSLGTTAGFQINVDQSITELEKKFQDIVFELKEQNKRNKFLLKKNMEFIDFNINVMSRTVADPLYAAKGASTSILGRNKIFDQTI
jgi:flagellar biosynthesis/type III secretory pathway chaperone